MEKKSNIGQVQAPARANYHHGDLRAQLLAAVRELIEEKGAENFSIAEAARKAGVSTAAPYRHFADKPAILKAVVLSAMAEMNADMKAAIANHPEGSIERVQALGMKYIEFAKTYPGVFRIVFGLSEAHGGDEELEAGGQKNYDVVIGAVADHLKLPHDHPIARQRAYMLWTVVHGHSWLTIDGKTKAEDIDVDEQKMLMEVGRAILGAPV